MQQRARESKFLQFQTFSLLTHSLTHSQTLARPRGAFAPKKAELDRKNDEEDIAKLEKAIGSTDKKRLKRALRQINENLERHVEVLDSVEKTRLLKHLSEKCKQYTKNLLSTIQKADKVIAKLGF